MPRPAASFTDEDDALLDELGVEVELKPTSGQTVREERIIAGFEDIQRFAAEHGRPPQHGEDRDIFERLYAVRLDRLRREAECRTVLEPLDYQGLLARALTDVVGAPDDSLDDDALLAQLGIDNAEPEDLTELRHVRSAAERKTAEDVAKRQPCEDFGRFKPLFEQVQDELSAGLRRTRRFERKAEIALDRFYILGGQKAYVAEMENRYLNEQGKLDGRLRVVFDNGTESNLLMRSLQRALQQDPTGRRIMEATAGPLFAGQSGQEENEDGGDDKAADGDAASGTVYVVRSRSDHPTVAAHRTVLHKIGVTGGDVARRVANTRLDPTFLMADVEVVATYELFNINRTRLEHLIHRIFAPARLAIEVKDRFGQPVVPREWFLVPLSVINETVERIQDGSVAGCIYDPKTATLTQAAEVNA